MQRRTTADLSHILPDILAPWDLTKYASSARRLTGGNLHDMFHIHGPGRPFALRVYAEGTIRGRIEAALPWIQHLASQLPEVPELIAVTDGGLMSDAHNRFATLASFIEGTSPDPTIPADRTGAAHALARIHRASATIPNPLPRFNEPAWRDLNWQVNHVWNVAEILDLLDAVSVPTDIDGREIRSYIESSLGELPLTFARLATLNLPDLVIHGDFYDQNLIARDNRIVGIIDWDDDMRLDWRVWDISNAAREFSRGAHTDPIDAAVANQFVAEYIAAGGEVTSAERSAILDLIHVRILWETLYDLAEVARGYESDWHYITTNIHSADHLYPNDFI